MTKEPHGSVREPSSNHRRQQHQFIIMYQDHISFLVLQSDGFEIFFICLYIRFIQVRPSRHVRGQGME